VGPLSSLSKKGGNIKGKKSSLFAQKGRKSDVADDGRQTTGKGISLPAARRSQYDLVGGDLDFMRSTGDASKKTKRPGACLHPAILSEKTNRKGSLTEGDLRLVAEKGEP